MENKKGSHEATRKKGRPFLSEGLMSWARAAIGEGEKITFSKAEKSYKNNSREAIISPKGWIWSEHDFRPHAHDVHRVSHDLFAQLFNGR